ncbi:MAG: metalloprotease TldD, partial [Pseudomonadota bacterium]
MTSLRPSPASALNASITSSTVRPTAASTSERLEIAQKLLLAPFGLTEAHLSRALGEITSHGADDADLYFQYTRSEGWS